MGDPFFDQPVVNSPYAYTTQHWELDEEGQPTQQVIPRRRPAKFVTPIPKPKKRRRARQQELDLDNETNGAVPRPGDGRRPRAKATFFSTESPIGPPARK